MSQEMNIGSEGIRIEYEGTAVEFDYTENQVIVEERKPETDNYYGTNVFEKDEDSLEFFIQEITTSLSENTETDDQGNRYRIELLGNLPGTKGEVAEVYTGKARVNAGIHEEEGFPREAYRLWESFSNKAKQSKVKAD